LAVQRAGSTQQGGLLGAGLDAELGTRLGDGQGFPVVPPQRVLFWANTPDAARAKKNTRSILSSS
jgi:hypothetical protein